MLERSDILVKRWIGSWRHSDTIRQNIHDLKPSFWRMLQFISISSYTLLTIDYRYHKLKIHATCYSRRETEAFLCDLSNTTFSNSRDSLARMSVIRSSVGCLRSRLMVAWISSLPVMWLSVYLWTNHKGIGFSTQGSNHERAAPQPLHYRHRQKQLWMFFSLFLF